jgi:hypothetical protein
VASAEEIAWAAGLFEGEGAISRHGRSGKFDLRVSLNMTDEDVVRRFDAIVDRGKIYGPYSSYRGHKPVWNWVALGDAGHDVVDLIGPWLSPRRVSQATAHGVLLPSELGTDLPFRDQPWPRED